uniref:Uncharacterized protein n=1 Tax=Magallana gigas TaxID=29159 RepID=K1PLT8_MAGGI
MEIDEIVPKVGIGFKPIPKHRKSIPKPCRENNKQEYALAIMKELAKIIN